LIKLRLGVVPHGFGGVGTEELRDLRLRSDLPLHPLGIEVIDETCLGVPRARLPVAGNLADRRLRGAVLTVTVLAQSHPRALRGELAAGAKPCADVHTHAPGVIGGGVGDIGGGEGALGVEGVFVISQ